MSRRLVMALLSFYKGSLVRNDTFLFRRHLPSKCHPVAGFVPFALLACFLLPPALWASDGGSLLGTITDPNGAAIPRAKITATETATSVKQSIVTDGQGFYSFQSLPVG